MHARSRRVYFFFSGALLLKGFSIDSGADFQEVVQQYSPDLSDEYRGTSPRKLIPGTKVSQLLAVLLLASVSYLASYLLLASL